MKATSARQKPIAVVGVSALFPGSIEKDGFWKNILDGRDLIDEVPPSHWLIEDYYDPDPSKPGKTYSRRGAFLDPTPFDPLDHGVPPSALPSTDSAQLLALIVAKRVLEDACKLNFTHIDRSRTSVILGVASATELAATMAGSLQYPVWLRAMRDAGLSDETIEAVGQRANSSYAEWTESTFPGLLGNVVAGRIANRFNLGGVNCVVDAACASSLAAVRMAVQELTEGSSDMVITGGVDALNDIFMYVCFSRTPAMSPSGDCRPFSTSADGTVLGEGLGMIALRRLDDAERDGDHIYAVLRGVGASSDGRSKSIYAPRPEGQALALRRAYEAAGYGPETIELMEAHGTGTVAGDAAEVQSLVSVFCDAERADRPWCALGSIKSQIGHTKGAAGAASLIKVILALHHKVLPPTIKVETPHEMLSAAGQPFYVNSRLRPWVRGKSHPRRGSVSSFGFGGSNFHIALEEYVGQTPRPARVRHLSSELFLFSAGAPDILPTKVAAAAELASSADAFAFAARTSQSDFDHAAPYRLALIAANGEELSSKAKRFSAHMGEAPESGFAEIGFYYGCDKPSGKLAFLFPGQGSQYIGMGAELMMAFDMARSPWDDIADAEEEQLRQLPGIVFPPPAFGDAQRRQQDMRLTATEYAQPAIGVTSLAYLAMLEATGLRADLFGGHSFGELTALVAAEALPKNWLPKVALERGRLMAEAAAAIPGAMLAVLASRSQVERCQAVQSGSVVIANHNSPQQIVVAGPVAEIDAFAGALSERAIEVRRLPVSTAFHSPLVAAAARPLEEFLRGVGFADPRTPVYSNVTAKPYPSASAIAPLVAEQLCRPVLFHDQIEAMYADGARIFVEIGPGAALSQLVGQSLAGRNHLAVSLDGKMKDAVWRLWSAFGQLCSAGLALELNSFWEASHGCPPAAETRSPVTVGIRGANFGKRYPPLLGEEVAEPSDSSRPFDAAAPAPPNSVVEEATPLFDSFARRGVPKALSAPLPENNAAARDESCDRFATPAEPVTHNGDAQLSLIEKIMRHSSEAHQIAQRAMADAHLAYLRTTEAALLRLAGDRSSGTVSGVAAQRPKGGAGASSAGAGLASPQGSGLDRTNGGSISPATPLPFRPNETDTYPRPDVMVEAAFPGSAETTKPQRLAAIDLSTLVLEIIAKKTGYPTDMLKPEMELEADLGIDSIKRVEILSALRDSSPNLPVIDVNELAELRTIGSIVQRLSATGVGRLAQAQAPANRIKADLPTLVLDVIAKKTGYPADMLKPQMELESDLGIDSIKRVEILSALRNIVPDLPAIDVSELAALRTIGAISARLDATSPSAPLRRSSVDDSGAGTRQPALSRFVPQLIEAPSPKAPCEPAPHTATILDGYSDELPQALAVALKRRGLAVQRISSMTDHHAVETDAFVVLTGRSASDPSDAAEQSFRAAQAYSSRALREGGLFATVQDTGGDFGFSGRDLSSAWRGGLPGLVKTAAQEWPDARTKAIDLEAGGRHSDVLADALTDELLNGGCELEVGLGADNRRKTIRQIARGLTLRAVSQPSRLPDRPVLVVTGGARGVTAECVVALAKTTPCRLVLLGRTLPIDVPARLANLDDTSLKSAVLAEMRARGDNPPQLRETAAEVAAIQASRAIQTTLQRLSELGCDAIYETLDIADAESTTRIIAKVRRRWGSIDGFIHGAGQLSDKLIAQKSAEQFRRVFDTKVVGLKNLLEATAGDDLKLIALFSSVAGRYGNAGQSDYAMANEVMSKVARAEAVLRGDRCLVRSIDWGPWDGGMVTPTLKRWLGERGVSTISLAEGAAAFVKELLHAAPLPDETEILLGGGPVTEASLPSSNTF